MTTENHETIGAPPILRELVHIRDELFDLSRNAKNSEEIICLATKAYGVGNALASYRRGLRLRNEDHEDALVYALNFVAHEKLNADDDDSVDLPSYKAALEIAEEHLKAAYKELLSATE